MEFRPRLAVWFVCLFTLSTSFALGQDSRGTLSGRVTDGSGAVIPDAEVIITNAQTSVAISARTNDSGIFSVPFLLPSTYRVLVRHAGFRPLEKPTVEVQVGAKVQLDLLLTTGEVSQSVEVDASAPVIETGSASLGLVVGKREIQNLPMASGNVAELATLSPGVSKGSGIAVNKAAFNSGTSSIVTDGNSINSNEWTIDGIPNMFASGTAPRIAFSPPPMTIAEFKVMTTFYDAALGHTSGGIINMNTQSGTDLLHGELHEFLGNSALNANTYFANRAGQKKAVYQDNRYGGAIGGPVYIPHLYDGRKKTFFYYAYEANKWGVPQSFTGTVPTAAERTGDFSALLGLGSNYTIYDPRTTTLANGIYSRTPFANNIIPPSRLNATAMKLMQLYPMPKTAGSTGGFNNYVQSNLKAREDWWAHFIRLDHNFSDRSRMFLRIDYDHWTEIENEWFGKGNPATGFTDGRTNRGAALDEVYTINSSNILDVRYGITAQEFPGRPLNTGVDLSGYGFSSGFASLFPQQNTIIPNMTFSSFSQFGISPNELSSASSTSLIHSIAGSMTSIVRNHSLHYGVDVRVNRANQKPYNTAQALLNFSSTYTGGPTATSAASPIGQDLAAFMLGLPGGTVQNYSSYADQDVWYGAYLQDDWRATPKLTLNLGLRIEHETPVTERYNRAVNGFDATSTSPLSAAATANYAASPMPGLAVSDFKVLGGLTFAGGSHGRSLWKGQAAQIMPRIAFSYAATPKTVLRGGYGLFFDSIGTYRSPAIQTGFSSTTSVLSSIDNGITYQASLDNPVPSGLVPVTGASGGLSTALGQALTYYGTKRDMPYAERWTFGFQTEFLRDFLLDVSYVGNRGLKLPIAHSINNTPASYLSRLNVRDTATINYLGTSYANPFYGLNSSYTKTTTRAQLLQPYPHFGTVSETIDVGSSAYNALQLELKKRVSYGFNLGVAYTYSKLLDSMTYLNATDPQPWYGVSQYDRPHRLAFSSVWDMPFGRGQLVGTNMPRWADYVAGGWHLNTIVTYQSGAALTFGNVFFNGNVGDIPLSSGQRTVNRWFNTSGFVTASAAQPLYNLRAFPLRLGTVRGDSQYLWNIGAVKSFPIHDRISFQLRGEAYNAFNHANMGDPSVAVTSSAFGTVTAQNGYARQIQIAGRILF